MSKTVLSDDSKRKEVYWKEKIARNSPAHYTRNSFARSKLLKARQFAYEVNRK